MSCPTDLRFFLVCEKSANPPKNSTLTLYNHQLTTMPMPINHQIANVLHFLECFALVAEGGIYQWKDTGHVYTKRDGKMYTTPKGLKDIRDITNKKFVDANIFLNQ